MSQAELSAPALRRAQLLLDDAEHNRQLVRLGHGVHNVNYATALLNAATEFCRKAEAIVDTDSPNRSSSQDSADPAGATAATSGLEQDEQAHGP